MKPDVDSAKKRFTQFYFEAHAKTLSHRARPENRRRRSASDESLKIAENSRDRLQS